MQLAQGDETGVYVVVSSDPNATPALSTLRALGRSTVVVSASRGEESPAAPTPPPVPLGSAWLHLQLCTSVGDGHPPPVAMPPTREEPGRAVDAAPAPRPWSESAVEAGATAAGSQVTEGTVDDCELAAPAAPEAAQNGSKVTSPSLSEVAAPNELLTGEDLKDEIVRCKAQLGVHAKKEWRMLERMPLMVKYQLLSSCLKRVSGNIFSQLKARMMQAPEDVSVSQEVSARLLGAKAFKQALVAGLNQEGVALSWQPHERVQVLQMLVTLGSPHLYGQLGFLLRVRPPPPLDARSRHARRATCANTPVAVLRMLDHLHWRHFRCRHIALPVALHCT